MLLFVCALIKMESNNVFVLVFAVFYDFYINKIYVLKIFFVKILMKEYKTTGTG